MSGKVEALWTKRSKGGVMDAAERLTAVEGKGLEGDANFGATRQVTIIEKEVLDAIMKQLPAAAPAMRRANIMVSGIRLENSRDQVLTVGTMKVHIRGETRPCELMDDQCPGLRGALDLHWGGGAHGFVIQSGDVGVGDAVTLEGPA
jgi:MOSC domain-containing protein YiiM